MGAWLSRVKKWLDSHAKAIQAAGALFAMVAAIGALVGVKMQIDANARQQREQSARDIYREFLNVSINQPKYAHPNYCALRGTPEEAVYEDYVEYMLYTAEQVLQAMPDWQETMEKRLIPHKELLCGANGWNGDVPEVQRLIKGFRGAQCTDFVPACD